MNKKILTIIGTLSVVALPITSVVSCGEQKSKILGMVLTNINNPFFKIIKDEAKKEAKKLGYELVVIDSGYDLSKESSAITQLVTMGAKAIIFNPMNAEGSAAAARIAKDAKIPIITVDTNLKDKSLIDSFVATDNVKGAHDLAAWAIAQDKKKDHSATHVNSFTKNTKIDGTKLFRVAGITGHSASLARWDNKNSFSSLVERTSPKTNFSDLYGYTRGGFKVATANSNFVITKTMDPAIIYLENDPMADGVISKLKTLKTNKKDIRDMMIISFDGSVVGIQLIKDGFLDATYAQKPIELAKKSIKNAIDIINGKKVNAQELLQGYIIDKLYLNKN